MNKIHVLSQETINRIAAGEVVERPISVIKELIENAIDAQSTAITVEIEDGGLKLIRVTDNGMGMDREDIRNAFVRHATSKIEDGSDLLNIGSLGFRGEALASVSAVAMVECLTKTSSATLGVRYVVEGGREKVFEDVGTPDGTTFLVKELFYNVPARKKFLKAPKTEANYVSDLMNRMALSHPGISFKFINNGKVKLHTSGNFSLKDCIYQVFGREFAKGSRVVDYTSGDLQITGFVGEPTLGRGNRQYEIYFVNGRYIKSKWIQSGLEEGAKDGMMIGQFPFAVLFIKLPNEQVDVNVHPNKMQVRFNDEQGIRNHTAEAIRRALMFRNQIQSVSLSEKEDQAIEKRIQHEEKKVMKQAPEAFEVKNPKLAPHESKVVETTKREEQIIGANTDRIKVAEASVDEAKAAKVNSVEVHVDIATSDMAKPEDPTVQPIDRSLFNRLKEKVETETQQVIEKDVSVKAYDSFVEEHAQVNEGKLSTYIASEQVTMPSIDQFLDAQQIKKHKIIGQVFKTYWLVEFHDEMYIIDQHAAHEKVLYEAWVKQIKAMKIGSQMLLEPKVYHLSEEAFDLFEQLQSDLQALGFEVEDFGDSSIVVKSVPYILNRPLNDLNVIVLFDQLVEKKQKLQKEEHYLNQLASIACKAAIKGNDPLSVVEYEALIGDMLYLDDPYHCPHGRPTMIRMSRKEMEKKFRRIL
jgi:DNA mismatch repair protein MutL